MYVAHLIDGFQRPGFGALPGWRGYLFNVDCRNLIISQSVKLLEGIDNGPFAAVEQMDVFSVEGGFPSSWLPSIQ